MAQDDLIATGPRVTIRRWQRQDYHIMDRWPPFTDPLSVIWNLPDRVTVGERDWNHDIRRTYAVQMHNGTLLGRITLRNIDSVTASARLGITIGSPFVSQGLGTEALRTFLGAFFGVMHFQTMVLDVAAVNERAVRCYRRLGFQQTGIHWRDAGSRFLTNLDPASRQRVEPYIRQGRQTVWVQFYDMTLLRDHWHAQRSAQTMQSFS
jgi:RimJ/RimL family protein N-acetyltransferase